MNVSCLIDTDWAIDCLNDMEPVASEVERLREERAGLSIISLAELYEGVHFSIDPDASERKLLGFLSGIAVLGIDEGICETFGKERGKLREKGLLIGDFDLLITSTSLYYGIPLCTNNRRRYERIEGLRLISV